MLSTDVSRHWHDSFFLPGLITQGERAVLPSGSRTFPGRLGSPPRAARLLLKPTEHQIYARDGYSCQMCHEPYRDYKVSRLEAHHILSRSQARRLRLTLDQLDDARNRITLCLRCHSFTYGKRKGRREPEALQRLEELQKAKQRIGFYQWFEEIESTIDRGRRRLLLVPESYGISPFVYKKLHGTRPARYQGGMSSPGYRSR